MSSATAGQIAMVNGMIENELAARERHKRERMLRRARFPQVKSFEGFDYSQVSFPERYAREDLESLAFADAAQDFVFHGKTGRGKTHLAIATSMACVVKAKTVRFFTAADLVPALAKASREHEPEALLKDLYRSDLMVVGELGYVPIDREGARLLFQVMSDCYERRSVIITTNIELGGWGAVFGDDKLASTLIDRLMHHGRLVEFGGGSKRMEDALMPGKPDRWRGGWRVPSEVLKLSRAKRSNSLD